MADAPAPTIAWSIPNLITVTLMVVLTFVIVGFLYRGFLTITSAQKSTAPVAGEVGAMS